MLNILKQRIFDPSLIAGAVEIANRIISITRSVTVVIVCTLVQAAEQVFHTDTLTLESKLFIYTLLSQ